MKIELYLQIVLVVGLLGPGITYAREMYWQVKDLVDKADIIAKVYVKHLDYKNDDLMIRVEHPNGGGYSVRHNPDYDRFMDVEFLVNDVLKVNNKHLHLSTLTIPALKGVGISPKPISFVKDARYLVFLKYGNRDRRLQSLQLVSPTSGAVRLEGNKTIRKPSLLDGYPPKFRRFNEPQLLERIQELIEESRSCSLVGPDRAKQLQEYGYSTDTPEQIIEATKSESYFVRFVTLELLTHRIREQAVPTLKEALSDPHITVRCISAHLLGTLGDSSGLGRMRMDFAELVPRNGAPEPADPNIAKDSEALKQWQRHRRYRIRRALKVAKVLAELGDRRGYELAVRMPFEKPLQDSLLDLAEQKRLTLAYGGLRSLAIKILTEIAKTDESILAAEGKDPVFVLCVMAESEKRRTVFKDIVMSAEQLRGSMGVRILEKAKDNPYQSEQDLRRVKRSLERLKAKMYGQELRRD